MKSSEEDSTLVQVSDKEFQIPRGNLGLLWIAVTGIHMAGERQVAHCNLSQL